MTEVPAIRILLLDDEPFALKLLGHIVASLGYSNVTSCNGARAALDYIDSQARPPDLILCDLNMPEMDGIEFIRKLVEHHYRGSLILISGEDERILQAAERLVQVHRINVLGHLQKPVSPAALARMIGKCSPPSAPRDSAAVSTYGAEVLGRAIANGEIVNYYQPMVSTQTGQVIGVETLARWRHPADGLISPAHFIGVAEEAGLINALTNSVLASALHQAGIWRADGRPVQVAVNISMDYLKALDFPETVEKLAADAGVPAQAIVLEVTESRLVVDLRATLEILTRLRLKRFNISIDDFGTGNSSLSQLRDMPFNELKIDSSFVHRAHADDTLRAMYTASLDLANKLQMGVVAEGVETDEDWAFVRSTGCDLAQGFFIGAPMPAADFPGWMNDWEARIRDMRLMA